MTTGTTPLSMSSTSPLPKVVVTGGTGNLGSKLSKHLLSFNPPKYRVHLIEHLNFFNESNVSQGATVTKGDVGDIESGLQDGGWVHSFDDADSVIHFSAVNPYPNATWAQSAESMDHCCNIFNVACSKGVRRVIFATSNHTMGGYKDVDPQLETGTLRTDLPPMVGTKLRDAVALEASGDAVAYGAAKLCGERLAASLAALHAPRTTFVCLRIGWCQPGENRPETLSAAGSPPEFQTETGASEAEKKGEDETDELWFKGMWLSNRDFLAYFEAALAVEVPLVWGDGDQQEVEVSKQPHRHLKKGFLLLNAMSRNSGAKWDLKETEKYLGVTSQDDSFR